MKAKEFCVDKFLSSKGLSLEHYDFTKDLKTYLSEMQKGLDSSSTLPMLPTYIEDREIPEKQQVLVLDAGGTNFRAAIVEFSENNDPLISDFRKRGMPGVEKEYSYDEFFDTIADFIADLAVKVDRIGFCFSYPMIKTADKDGRLIAFSKEIKAPEVVGKLIGRGVLDALNKRGISNIKHIVLLNDTVATLLAGKAAGKSGAYDSFIGLILGTGVNASYNEKNSQIGKLNDLPVDGSQLINMEAGACSVLPSGKADEEFRAKTAFPEAYQFEKMVSGGYLGVLWFDVICMAAEEGCFSMEFKEAVVKAAASGLYSSIDSSDLSKFISESALPDMLSKTASEYDIQACMKIGLAIRNRAAYLASVMISGIVLKTGRGHGSDKPVCLCIDGTTFWKLSGLKEEIEMNLKKYLGESGVHYKIIGLENAPVIGAAVAGLTND